MFIFLHGGLNYDKILRVKKDLRILHFILSIFNNSIRLKKQIIISIILRTQIQRHCTEFQHAANCSDCIFIFRPFQIKKPIPFIFQHSSILKNQHMKTKRVFKRRQSAETHLNAGHTYLLTARIYCTITIPRALIAREKALARN